MTQEQIKAAIEQEARDKYPEDIRRIFEERDYEGWDHDFNGEARAAYVEGKMSMLSEIDRAWDNCSLLWCKKIKEWDLPVPDDRVEIVELFCNEGHDTAKAEYINNLFKKQNHDTKI